MNPQSWQKANVNGAELEFLDHGNGDPIVFVHGAMGRKCSAVLAEPMLAGFRIIHFQRRGYGGKAVPRFPAALNSIPPTVWSCFGSCECREHIWSGNLAGLLWFCKRSSMLRK